MDLSIRIISDDGEYQVIVEGDGFTRVSRASSIKEVIDTVGNELSELLRDREEKIELKPSDCTLRGWYIRLPISKIINIITYMVKSGNETTEGVLKYLDENGLSKSNYRVIIPTLSSLGLWRQGRLTKDAEELGKAFMNNDDALEILFRISMKNCVIKNAIEELANGRTIEDVIKKMELKRQDEIKYTINFLETLMNTREFQCLAFLRSVSNYLNGTNNCAPSINPPTNCTSLITMEVYNYLINNRNFHIVELMNDVDIAVNPNSLTIQPMGNYALLLFSGKAVGAVLGNVVITNNNYAPKARETVDKLEEEALKIMRSNNLNFTLIIVPIVIQGDCPRMKAYIMVGTKTGEWIARVFEVP